MNAHLKAKRKTRKPETAKTGNVAVKIYRRRKLHKATGKRYAVWEVADYSTGARRLLSFSDHKEAVAAAKKIADLLASGESTAAAMRGPQAASYGRAVELARPTGAPLELIASRYAACVAILGTGELLEQAARHWVETNPANLPARTVAEVVAELLAAKEARGKSARYLQDLKNRLERFAESFHVGIASVSTGEVQRWLDAMKAAPQTVKNYRTVIHTLFAFAEARGYIRKNSNPVASTEAIQANGADVEIYAPAEMARLLAAAKSNFLPSLALAGFAGLRTAEILRLEWNDVDLQGGHITIGADKAKTASRRIVPISANLAAWLAPYAGRSGKVWKGTHEDFYDAQQATAAATAADNTPALSWKTNALRHSYASYRLAQTQNAAQVSMEMGNSSAVVFKHYRELVKPADAEKWFAIRPEAPANVVRMEAAA